MEDIKMEVMFTEMQRRIERILLIESEIKDMKKEIGDIYISEADTQAVLVEPILSFAGFDVGNVLEVRRSRSGESDFDLKIYKGGKLLIGIEVKRVGSDEFNIDAFRKGEEVGKLEEKEKEKPKDGIGQLRRYAGNYWHNMQQLVSQDLVAILTNGIEWGVFKNIKAFTENPEKPLRYDSFWKNPLNFEYFNIENLDDFKGLIEFLRKKLFGKRGWEERWLVITNLLLLLYFYFLYSPVSYFNYF